MRIQPFGNSGLGVTPMGLGLAALGRPGYINLGHSKDLGGDRSVAAMQSHAFAVLDAAWDLGIRYFDAARSYGRAEEFLSAWLRSREIPTDEVTVGSKWGYTYTANWQVTAEKHEVKEHKLPVLRKQIAESKSLLGPYLKLYQIHSATLDSGVLENDEVLSELAQLRAEGLIIGLSLSGPKQAETLRKALTVTCQQQPLFGAVQATWNLLERSVGDALREARAQGLGVIVKESVANGRLTDRNPDVPAPLGQIAEEMSVGADAVALCGAMAQDFANVTLSGAATVEQVCSNCRAIDMEWTESMIQRTASIQEPSDEYWSTRSSLAWN